MFPTLLAVKVRWKIEIYSSTLTIYRLFLFASNETDFNDNELPSSTFRWSFQISSQRPVWPELAKILHFGNIKTSCAIFSRAFLINFEPTLAISYVIRQTFIVVNGLKKWYNHLVTLSQRPESSIIDTKIWY